MDIQIKIFKYDMKNVIVSGVDNSLVMLVEA